MITKEILMQNAKAKGLTNKEHIEKDYFQDKLLYSIYRQTNLLVFKGGTALYKLYNLPRFSEDLDFSIINKLDAPAIIKNVAKSFNEIKK
ncbi:MAG: nucleotidyl transferase AbiEii/AbiGii toxin family protein, partial [Nanoarchaeota archaeon]